MIFRFLTELLSRHLRECWRSSVERKISLELLGACGRVGGDRE